MHVINLHGAKCESRRNVKIESAAEHNGPCRVALARSNPNKAPGVAEKRMSKEQHTATRIKELRTHREIAQVHLRAICKSKRWTVKTRIRVAPEDLNARNLLRNRQTAESSDAKKNQ